MNKQTISKVLNFCDAVSKKNNIQQLPYELILHISKWIKIKCFECNKLHHKDEIHKITNHKIIDEDIRYRCGDNPNICYKCLDNQYFICECCMEYKHQHYRNTYHNEMCEECIYDTNSHDRIMGLF